MQILQSRSISSPSSISQAAAVAVLNHSANFFDGWLNALDRRHQQVLGIIVAIDSLNATAPQGVLYMFANCQVLMGRMTLGNKILRNDSVLVDRLLEQTQMAVLHGFAFGMPGHLRIAYAIEDGLLTQVYQRIAGACVQSRQKCVVAQRLPTWRRTTFGLKNAVLTAYLANKHIITIVAHRVMATLSFPVFHSTVTATTAHGKNSILRIASNKATSLQLNLYQTHKTNFRCSANAIKNTMLTAIPEC